MTATKLTLEWTKVSISQPNLDLINISLSVGGLLHDGSLGVSGPAAGSHPPGHHPHPHLPPPHRPPLPQPGARRGGGGGEDGVRLAPRPPVVRGTGADLLLRPPQDHLPPPLPPPHHPLPPQLQIQSRSHCTCLCLSKGQTGFETIKPDYIFSTEISKLTVWKKYIAWNRQSPGFFQESRL